MGRVKLLLSVLALSLISLASAQDFNIPITITDGLNSQILTIGVDTNGTEGFDPGLDLLAPPPPPSGAFDARLRNLNEDYLTDIRDNSLVEKQFHMLYSIETGQGPIKLFWDSSNLNILGSFLIVDDITGGLFGPIDMTSTDSLEVTDPNILDKLKILVTPYLVQIPDFEIQIPKEFKLMQNYPNPFNPTTTIQFSLPEVSHVKLEIFNVMGQEVQTLASKYMQPGKYTFKWDGINYYGVKVSSGIYLYKMQAGDFIKIMKMVLMK